MAETKVENGYKLLMGFLIGLFVVMIGGWVVMGTTSAAQTEAIRYNKEQIVKTEVALKSMNEQLQQLRVGQAVILQRLEGK